MENAMVCQQFMNQLGPDWGGGVAFQFSVEPKGCQLFAVEKTVKGMVHRIFKLQLNLYFQA